MSADPCSSRQRRCCYDIFADRAEKSYISARNQKDYRPGLRIFMLYTGAITGK